MAAPATKSEHTPPASRRQVFMQPGLQPAGRVQTIFTPPAAACPPTVRQLLQATPDTVLAIIDGMRADLNRRLAEVAALAAELGPLTAQARALGPALTRQPPSCSSDDAPTAESPVHGERPYKRQRRSGGHQAGTDREWLGLQLEAQQLSREFADEQLRLQAQSEQLDELRDSTEERAVHLEAAAPAAATAPDAAEASGAVATTAAQRNNAVTGGRQEQRHPVVVQGAQRHSSIALSAAGAAGAQIEKALGQAASAKAATTRGTRAEQNARREAAAAAVDPPQSGAWHQQPLTPELAQQLSRQHMRAQVNEVYRSATGSSATGIPAQSDGCTAANANTAAAASTVVAAFVPAQSNERTTANAPTSADASADAAAVVHVPAPVATPQRLAASRSAQAEAELAAVEKAAEEQLQEERRARALEKQQAAEQIRARTARRAAAAQKATQRRNQKRKQQQQQQQQLPSPSKTRLHPLPLALQRQGRNIAATPPQGQRKEQQTQQERHPQSASGGQESDPIASPPTQQDLPITRLPLVPLVILPRDLRQLEPKATQPPSPRLPQQPRRNVLFTAVTEAPNSPAHATGANDAALAVRAGATTAVNAVTAVISANEVVSETTGIIETVPVSAQTAPAVTVVPSTAVTASPAGHAVSTQQRHRQTPPKPRLTPLPAALQSPPAIRPAHHTAFQDPSAAAQVPPTALTPSDSAAMTFPTKASEAAVGMHLSVGATATAVSCFATAAEVDEVVTEELAPAVVAEPSAVEKSSAATVRPSAAVAAKVRRAPATVVAAAVGPEPEGLEATGATAGAPPHMKSAASKQLQGGPWQAIAGAAASRVRLSPAAAAASATVARVGSPTECGAGRAHTTAGSPTAAAADVEPPTAPVAPAATSDTASAGQDSMQQVPLIMAARPTAATSAAAPPTVAPLTAVPSTAASPTSAHGRSSPAREAAAPVGQERTVSEPSQNAPGVLAADLDPSSGLAVHVVGLLTGVEPSPVLRGAGTSPAFDDAGGHVVHAASTSRSTAPQLQSQPQPGPQSQPVFKPQVQSEPVHQVSGPTGAPTCWPRLEPEAEPAHQVAGAAVAATRHLHPEPVHQLPGATVAPTRQPDGSLHSRRNPLPRSVPIEAVDGAQPSTRPGEYAYTMLHQVDNHIPPDGGSGTCHVYAIVAEASQPRMSRGTDWVVNMRILDPSSPVDSQGTEVMLFGNTREQLPTVRRGGDIIRLHRLKVQRFRGRLQLSGKIGFPVAFCLFQGNKGGPHEPYHHSGRNFAFGPPDIAVVDQLREYRADLHQGGGASKWRRFIREVAPGTFFDIVCKVLVVRRQIDSDGSHLLFVWDGTDEGPLAPGLTTLLDPPRLAQTHQQQQAQQQQPHQQQQQQQQQQRPILRPVNRKQEWLTREEMEQLGADLPMVGSILPVFVAARVGGRLAPLPEPGRWVKLRNVGFFATAGQLQCAFHATSKWLCWVPNADRSRDELVALTQEYDQRVANNCVSGWAPNDPSEWAATTCHTNQPFTTLRQLAASVAAGGLPAVSRVLVRLVRVEPLASADVCRLASETPPAGDDDGGSEAASWVFDLRLTMRDATGEVAMLLRGPAAVTFLGGAQPRDMARAHAARSVLECVWDSLLNHVESPREGGVWMDVSFTTALAIQPANPAASEVPPEAADEQAAADTSGGMPDAAPLQVLHEIFDTRLAPRLRPLFPDT